jgi:hypothetical protein
VACTLRWVSQRCHGYRPTEARQRRRPANLARPALPRCTPPVKDPSGRSRRLGSRGRCMHGVSTLGSSYLSSCGAWPGFGEVGIWAKLRSAPCSPGGGLSSLAMTRPDLLISPASVVDTPKEAKKEFQRFLPRKRSASPAHRRRSRGRALVGVLPWHWRRRGAQALADTCAASRPPAR